MSRVKRKPVCENIGANQLRNNCEADQHQCFRYNDFYLNPKFFRPITILVAVYNPVYVGTDEKPQRHVFSRRGSNGNSRSACIKYL